MDLHQVFTYAFWIIFLIAFVIDFRFTGTKDRTMSVKKAIGWTLFWIAIAFAYDAFIYLYYPQNPETTVSTAHTMGLKFLSGFLMEKSLSVDNLFVFIVIFSSMGIREEKQAKLLKLGILLSIILRIIFILAGMSLVHQFEWLFYVFGGILVFTAIKMLVKKEELEEVHPEKNMMYKWASKIFPIDAHSDKLILFKEGKITVSYLFLALLVIASSDVLFAVDSIPAIIGIIREGAQGILTSSQENFIAISSNMFAVMGLASLYFALKSVMNSFHYLKVGVAVILAFIGFKMLVADAAFFKAIFEENHWISFAVIVTTIFISIIASIVKNKIEEKKG
ncbi:TerC/Alx family metal homeostasis membrane protein [Parabacteroides sp. FAFU027]|uniref:TerC/Alx family metal homeostasis membrane protein n=1 Tax=Parabacteroides sp. FAFU027 TaxID=2922715 RepID=UPI001FAECC37|nr:TerC/Alx family metal homeostasis membrane protein [Parabacteroides sp. FAFU027]